MDHQDLNKQSQLSNEACNVNAVKLYYNTLIKNVRRAHTELML